MRINYNSPENWTILSNDGTTIVAYNKISLENFSGTQAAFNAKIKQVVTATPLLIGSDGLLYDSNGKPIVNASLGGFGTVTLSTTNVTIKNGPGYLKSIIVIAKGTSPTIDLFNNTAASGARLIPQLHHTNVVGDFPAINVGVIYEFAQPLAFSIGLHCNIAGTGTTTINLQVA